MSRPFSLALALTLTLTLAACGTNGSNATHATDAGATEQDAAPPFVPVDPVDVSSITRALQQVLQSADRRSELTARGHVWAAELRWQDVAQRHIDVWEQLW